MCWGHAEDRQVSIRRYLGQLGISWGSSGAQSGAAGVIWEATRAYPKILGRHDAPRERQESAKMKPRWSQVEPRWRQDCAKLNQGSAKLDRDGAKLSQDGAKWSPS